MSAVASAFSLLSIYMPLYVLEVHVLPRMNPYDPILPPSQAAREWAIKCYDDMRRSSPDVVDKFEDNLSRWQRTWHVPPASLSSSAERRCDVDEFDELVDMGPQILPLVVYHLLDSHNFTCVFLYNALETDETYLVDRRDILNFLVLQRQNNLIVEINEGRHWARQ